MCGIAGWFGFGSSPKGDAERLAKQMAYAIRHRGPDSQGVWLDPSIDLGLAHARLSILDLSDAGHQPMYSACERFVLVFNGEIYNHKDLKTELLTEDPAMEFVGASDTEVLLNALVRWGLEPTLRKLNGMFAFALWDRDSQTLSLARDRFGEKPLYFGSQGDDFLFASELSALKQHPAWQGKLNRQSVALLCQYLCIPAPYSIYQGINKLLPGHSLTITNGEIGAQECYWSVDNVVADGGSNQFQGSSDEALNHLETLLTDSVKLRIEADVPVGAFLSGGIDSSLITSLMKASATAGVNTYSIGFAEQGFNEAVYAKQVAEYLNTDHHELYVTQKDSLSVVPDLPSIYDEPFADSSQIPVYLLSRFARTDVTVALSGDAGDEVFGGYHRHIKGQKLWGNMCRLPKPMRSGINNAVHAVSPDRWDWVAKPFSRFMPASLNSRTFGAWLHKTSALIDSPSPEQLYQNLLSVNPSSRSLVKHSGAVDFHWGGEWADNLPTITERMMWSDSKGYLSDDILTKVDRATMAVGLEARVPFLDHRVVEFAWRLPLSQKIHSDEGKQMLRSLLAKHIPRELFERPKQGFGVPIGEWLRGGLRPWAEELLAAERLEKEGVFNVADVRKYWELHLSRQRDNHHLLWPILMFQAWLEDNQDVSL